MIGVKLIILVLHFIVLLPCETWLLSSRSSVSCFFSPLLEFIKKNSVALSPRANYTDWATATCRRNLVPTFVDRGVSPGQRGGSPTVVNLSFLDRLEFIKSPKCFWTPGHLQAYNSVREPFEVAASAAGPFWVRYSDAVNILPLYEVSLWNFLSCWSVRQSVHVLVSWIHTENIPTACAWLKLKNPQHP
jgi:hypothetical protein